jgi:hypothetical protein
VKWLRDISRSYVERDNRAAMKAETKAKLTIATLKLVPELARASDGYRWYAGDGLKVNSASKEFALVVPAVSIPSVGNYLMPADPH